MVAAIQRRCRRTGARTEESEGQNSTSGCVRIDVAAWPRRSARQGDVEDLPAVDGLFRCQEVEEQRCSTGIAEPRRDVLISGAVLLLPLPWAKMMTPRAVSGTTSAGEPTVFRFDHDLAATLEPRRCIQERPHALIGDLAEVPVPVPHSAQ